jgi:hypothetical protein
MSGKRDDPSNLCRFTFTDGRRCRSLAHHAFDGLCFQHGTFRPRASRQDNFLREIAPLAKGSSQVEDCAHAYRALLRAAQERRISSDQLRVLQNLSALIRSSGRYADAESWACASGPAWDKIRKLIDGEIDANSLASRTSPDAFAKCRGFIGFRGEG